MTPARTSDRTSFDPLSAGGVLLAVLVACVAIGALVGWAAGGAAIGAAVGAFLGIPAAIGVVYFTYRGSF